MEFDADETYVQTITEGGLSTPRSIAFAPVGDPIPTVSSWGLVGLALLFAGAGASVMAGRRHSRFAVRSMPASPSVQASTEPIGNRARKQAD